MQSKVRARLLEQKRKSQQRHVGNLASRLGDSACTSAASGAALRSDGIAARQGSSSNTRAESGALLRSLRSERGRHSPL